MLRLALMPAYRLAFLFMPQAVSSYPNVVFCSTMNITMASPTAMKMLMFM